MTDLILPTRMDGALVNTVLGAGVPGRDKSLGWQVGSLTILDQHSVEVLHGESDVCSKVVEVLPEEMTREWIELTIDDGKPDLINEAIAYDKKLGLAAAFREATRNAYLYGGAIAILYADDGQTPDRPLDEKRVKTIEGVSVLDRWQVMTQGGTITDPDYYQILYSPTLNLVDTSGKPLTFQNTGQWNGLIHKTRVLRFDGDWSPQRVRQYNQGWGFSKLQRFLKPFQDYFSVFQALGSMVQDASIFIYAIDGLMEIVKGGNKQLLRDRLKEDWMATSVYGARIADATKEKFSYLERNFSNLDQILDRFERRMVAACDGLPHMVVLGRSGPNGGLDGNGEAEEKYMAKLVKRRQEKDFRQHLERCYQLIFAAKDGPSNGKEQKFGINFKPLSLPSPQEIADLEAAVIQKDATAISAGILTADEAAKSHYSTPNFNPSITIDWELREKLKAKEEAAAAAEEEAAQLEELLAGMEEDAPAEDVEPIEEEVPEVQADSLEMKKQIRWDEGKPCGQSYIDPNEQCRRGSSFSQVDSSDRLDSFPPISMQRSCRDALRRKPKLNFREQPAISFAQQVSQGQVPDAEQIAIALKVLSKVKKGPVFALYGGDEGLKWLKAVQAYQVSNVTDADDTKSKECPGGYRIPKQWNCRSSKEAAKKDRVAQLGTQIGKEIKAFAQNSDRRVRIHHEAKNGETIASVQLRKGGKRQIDGQMFETVELPLITLHDKIQNHGLSGQILSQIEKSFPEKAIYIENVNPEWAKSLLRKGWIQDKDNPYGYDLYKPPSKVDHLDAVRASCLECVEKHLGSALVLADETNRGWPDHRLLVIGHLSQAEEESADQYPLLSDQIRVIRKSYQSDGKDLDFQAIANLLRDQNVWRGDSDKSKPCPGGYRIPLSKKCRDPQKLKESVSHAGEHLGENVVAWGIGKAVGGAIASAAASHGFPPALSAQFAESTVQALAATALAARKKENRGAGNLAQIFVANAAGAFAGKFAHTGVDDAILGGDEHVQALAAAIAGKGTGATVTPSVRSTLRRGNRVLQRILGRQDGLRVDAPIGNDFQLTADEQGPLFDMALMGLLLAPRRTADSLQEWLEHRDRKGQGKPCGKGFISVKKKCSSDKAKQLASDIKAGDAGAKARVARGKELAAERQRLNREVQAGRGKKTAVKPDSRRQEIAIQIGEEARNNIVKAPLTERRTLLSKLKGQQTDLRRLGESANEAISAQQAKEKAEEIAKEIQSKLQEIKDQLNQSKPLRDKIQQDQVARLNRILKGRIDPDSAKIAARATKVFHLLNPRKQIKMPKGVTQMEYYDIVNRLVQGDKAAIKQYTVTKKAKVKKRKKP